MLIQANYSKRFSKGEKGFVQGIKDSIPGFSITYQENDDVFIRENMYVEHATVDDLKKKLDCDNIHRSTESPNHHNSIQEHLKDIILRDLIKDDGEKMKSKDVWKDTRTYDRSYSFPEVLDHDHHPHEVHAYAARIIPNTVDEDESTLVNWNGRYG